MHDVNHAIAVLRDVTGLADLDFQGGNHIELVIADSVPMHIVRLAENALELFAEVGNADGFSTDEFRACLSNNHLGKDTGAGRLALGEDGKTLVLGQRFHVTHLDAAALEAELQLFVGRAISLAETNGLGETPVPAPQSLEDPSRGELIIRG